MAEQLSFQANDGGSIPPMGALVDAKTTISVFGRVVMAAVSRSVGEIRAGSNPAARKVGRSTSNLPVDYAYAQSFRNGLVV